METEHKFLYMMVSLLLQLSLARMIAWLYQASAYFTLAAAPINKGTPVFRY